jgi:hypothetical protein
LDFVAPYADGQAMDAEGIDAFRVRDDAVVFN